MNQSSVESRHPAAPRSLPSSTLLTATLRYILAAVSIALALGLSVFLGNFPIRGVEIPLLLFAVAVSAWYGGGGPALLALLFSTVGFDYFFTEPLHTLRISRADLPYFGVFAAFAALVTWFSTLRRRVEAELRQARDKLEIEVAERTQQASLLNLTHDTIFVRDMASVITYWNRGAQELYGWGADRAIGRRSHDLLRTIFPGPIEDIDAELLRTGRWEGELRHTKEDGTPADGPCGETSRTGPTQFSKPTTTSPIRKRREQEIGSLNAELGKRTAELESINKELEAFAYSISHDLRAPLRHMAGYTELLRKNSGALLNEKGQRYITIITEAAQRMGNLIDDLLAFSRIGRAEAHKSMVNLDQLVEEALTEVRQDAGGREIVWKIGGLPDWYGDRSMLRLVLVNLMANAVKFTRTRAQAEIEIGCQEPKQNQVVVFVRDNGVGFDMKYVNKLFGVFQRLHPNDAFEGTGIGLATVQRIVHRHGGLVWAEGLVGQGATFYFSLSKSQELNA